MTTVHIEHSIRDYTAWKAAFDRFDGMRADHKVRRYDISQPVDDDQFVRIRVDFDSRPEAEAFLATMQGVWGSPLSAAVHEGPSRTSITETVEAREL